ncbi:hypothetical protein XAC3810_510065 [Xanthomonas citri pv. citri]|nr:hypothetical protein XAC9322_520063 [Xanthomonas citri pv. citri]CEJ45378.1 hypothetical protein XAB3213_3010002 [Xanthomonas citri pv. bilvae]CEE41123.1 hypothetical protein XAC3810_510065 [Xanthomonas citri pv. citri]CEE45949.1 hypothetical protein XAC908_750064 [Xanthomonas citri pv. citri]CEE52106.1 hypothetical protein XAC3608_1090054 [Xanthomonas citri pv. citri]
MRHACVANANRHALMGDDTARGIKRATACRQLAWCEATRARAYVCRRAMGSAPAG